MSRVLVVDDDPEAAELAARFLRPKGYEVETVFSGMEAIEKLKEGGFDVVISDVRMPSGSGVDLLRELAHADKKLPVVLVSADHKGAPLQAKALGADAFIGKPLTAEELHRVLKRLLGHPHEKPHHHSRGTVSPES